jgi:hypothetical protein
MCSWRTFPSQLEGERTNLFRPSKTDAIGLTLMVSLLSQSQAVETPFQNMQITVLQKPATRNLGHSVPPLFFDGLRTCESLNILLSSFLRPL